MAVIKDGVLIKIEENDIIDGIYIVPEEVKKISEQAFSEDYQEQKEKDTWMIVKKEKKDLQNEKDITEEEAIDIFGGLSEDTRKITKLANKSHREHPKNKYSILRISKSLKTVEYKAALEEAIKIIDQAIDKNVLKQEIAGYKWIEEDQNIDTNEFNIFNLNPEKEIEDSLMSTESGKVNLYKMNFDKNVKAVAFSNCVYYDNQNKTLPVGMDKDTRMLVKILDTDIILESKKVIRVGRLEDENDIASKLIIKTINVLEYGVKEIEE